MLPVLPIDSMDIIFRRNSYSSVVAFSLSSTFSCDVGRKRQAAGGWFCWFHEMSSTLTVMPLNSTPGLGTCSHIDANLWLDFAHSHNTRGGRSRWNRNSLVALRDEKTDLKPNAGAGTKERYFVKGFQCKCHWKPDDRHNLATIYNFSYNCLPSFELALRLCASWKHCTAKINR